MADTFIVKIDQAKLAANLKAAEGRDYSPIEVRQFLLDQGFMPTPDGWMAEDISLAALRKDEYIILGQMS